MKNTKKHMSVNLAAGQINHMKQYRLEGRKAGGMKA